MRKKICFVIMGFGKKTDPASGKTYDLDMTYKNIIQPAVDSCGYKCIRADEIHDNGLIDRSMYALLIYSDLVIADITTFNPNAVYELGVRHGVRPFSTIIMKGCENKLPFDINHDRIYSYRHLGEEIGYEETLRAKEKLTNVINSVKNSNKPDSPLYELIRSAEPWNISEEEYYEIIGELADRQDSLFAQIEKASQLMQTNDFFNAAKYWEKANAIAIDEPYYIQQRALCTYKSKQPDELTALTNALEIISSLKPDESNDPETLGITGAIQKRIFLKTGNIGNLDKAIQYYKKGYSLNSDYYTGENYANCLLLKYNIVSEDELKTYLMYESKLVRKEIIKHINNMLDEDIQVRSDRKWIYASMSICYYFLNDPTNSFSFKQKFLNENPLQWEIESYNETINILTK